MAKYLSKYMTKDSEIPFEFMGDLKGFHMYQSYGLDKIEKRQKICPCCGAEVITSLYVSELECNDLVVDSKVYREDLLPRRRSSKKYLSTEKWEPELWTQERYLSALYGRKVSG